MLRKSRENLHSIYVLLFLNIAFFFLQIQDPERYEAIFEFDRNAVLAGQFWRIFTYQFVQGAFLGSPALGLFFSLMILYIMGSAVEEELGTLHFAIFFFISTFGSAAVAFALGVPMLSSLFLSYSLLFVFARLHPDQTFYIFLVLPLKVRWLAWFALAILVIGVVLRSPSSLAAAGGAAASFGYFWLLTGQVLPRRRVVVRPGIPERQGNSETAIAERNLARFAEMNAALGDGSREKIAALETSLAAAIVPGVNICPPADYKPAHEDGYCVRCEGFPECSVRYLRLSAAAAGGKGQEATNGP